MKGGGGALLREKLVAQASRREVIVVDDSKPSPALGTRFALAGRGRRLRAGHHRGVPARPGCGARRCAGATDGQPYRTDSGNLIVDVAFGPIADPAGVGRSLADHAGVVEHGLFVGLADTLVVGHADGTVTSPPSTVRGDRGR